MQRLGPGFISGAADDDPSGIATYSIAGAQYGYKLNWLSLFLIPLMISVQEMCGRIGMCSGLGLAGVIKKYYSKKLLYFTVSLLVLANVVNISADLGVMAASMQILIGLPFIFWLGVITISSIILEIFIPYRIYKNVLTWMGLSLLVYGIIAIITKPDWLSIIKYTFIPHIDWEEKYFMTLVGFIGTTISPYLFFWQASEEVEEEIEKGEIRDFAGKNHITKKDINFMRTDTNIGMIFSNIMASFVVISTAATLYHNGIYSVDSPQQAALALKPLAGNYAFLLFTFGIIGIGIQSVPILAGGIAYAISETFGFKEGLAKKFNKAKAFYTIIGLATIIGAIINLIGINPIKALFYAAVLNGIISVPLIFIIIKLADDPRVVGNYRTSRSYRIIGWITFIFVSIATAFLLINLL